MEKKSVDLNINMYPMPVVLVGTVVDDQPDFIAVSWISRVDSDPSLFMISINKSNYSLEGILKNETFSINIPSSDWVQHVDYCGSVSGRNRDKSKYFKLSKGKLENAPLINQCPVSIECSLYKTVDLLNNVLVLGKVETVYAGNDFCKGGGLDVKKIDPILLTLPDNRYWQIGKVLGDVWEVGQKIQNKETKESVF